MGPRIEEITGRGNSTSDIFIAAPPPNAEALGTIAVFADFSELPQSLRYLGALIAAEAKREYYAQGGRSAATAFAKALEAANEALAKEAQQGTAQWIGALRAIIVAAANRKLLLSQSMGCAAMLLRNGTVTEIPLEAGEGSRPFGAMTEGVLADGDLVAIATRSSLIARNAEAELRRDANRFFKMIRKTTGSACLRIAVPKRSSLHSRLAFLQSLLASLPFPIPPLTIRTKIPAPVASTLQGIGRLRKRALSLGRTLMVLRAWRPLPQLHPARVPILRPRARTLLLSGSVAVVAVVTLSSLTIAHHRRTAEDMASREAIDAAQAELERGEAETILGNTKGALDAFQRGLAALESVRESDETANVRASLLERRNAIAGITQAEVTTIFDLRGFPVTLDANRLAILVRENGDIAIALAGPKYPGLWLNGKLEATGGTFLFFPPPLKVGVRDLSALGDGSLFLAATGDGLATAHPIERKTTTAMELPAVMTFSFLAPKKDGGVFALRPEDRAIATVELHHDGTLSVQRWLSGSDPMLQDARDLASLNGTEPYVLLPEHRLLRFRNGRRIAQYRIEGLGWDGEATALAALPQQRLLVLDAMLGRLLITNASGDIVQQLESPTLRGGRDIAVTPDGSAAFVLTPDAVLRVALQASSAAEK